MVIHQRMFLAQLFFSVVLLLPFSHHVAASDSVNASAEPPWLMASRHFNLIMFHADVAAVKPLLPPGVHLKINPQGKATLVLEAYEAERAIGTAPFQKALVAVQIEDYPNRAGEPAHFALWGTVAHPKALSQFQQAYNFPYSLAESIELQEQQGIHSGLVTAANNGRIRFRLQPLEDQFFAREGVVNMVGKLPDERLVLGEVPYLARGHVGKLIELDISPQGDPVLAVLQAAQPVWAMTSVDLTFSYANRTPLSPPVLAMAR